ncbi:MAG: amidinotransferase [Sphingobacteriales bacterium 41-5]|nr:MAG: amidinotransferase [Niabella sp. SCN 42-15]OJU22442.1 MAG: amidinotransferase [Sphingobacteriales bacterium 41-5]
MQTTSQILMIRPVAFGYNAETAINNAFQKAGTDKNINEQAQHEFDHFVEVLKTNGIGVTVIEDTLAPHTPDSIFPNNWASYHDDGTIVIYPMFASNRRREREKNVMGKLKETFEVRATFDLTAYEKDEIFLEGTGSMILDRENRIAYACASPRTHPTVLYDFCNEMNYTPVLFSAKDAGGQNIYHTNVMMCLADKYAVICMDSISNENEKNILLQKFQETGKEMIPISLEQMNRFAGNMLQVENFEGKKFLVMSSQAYQSLTKEQIEKLESHNPILHAPLNTIEQNGGGSARCMMAEIFLPLKNQSNLK